MATLVLAVILYRSVDGFIAGQFDNNVATEINEVLSGARDREGDALQRIRAEVTALTIEPETGMHYVLQDAQGNVLAGDLPALAAIPGLRDVHIRPGDALTQPKAMRGRGMLVANTAYLFVGIDSTNLEELREYLRRAFFGGFAATIVLALAGAAAMSLITLRRIEAISRTSFDIVDHDLSRRVPLRGSGDEFDQLARSQNTLFDRIQSLMTGLRQVSTDIAHDLRTPLARLRQRLDVARNKHHTVTAFQNDIDFSVREVDAILDTFGALLRITDIEAGNRKSRFTDLDFTDVLNSIIEIYQPVAEENEQTLLGHVIPGLKVRGDGELLTQMFANLIENAIRHTYKGSTIIVSGEVGENANARVLISDNGPGIPADLRNKVFQRLYRLETSRTTPGNGLGLSMVAAIATLHGLTIQLGDNQPGLKVDIVFPAI